MYITADKLKIGRPATVTALKGAGPAKKRLIDLGLTPGARIVLKRKAPFGDPLEFYVRGYRLAMRKKEAVTILAEYTER